MKFYTLTDLNRASGEILDTALVEPVTLTKHGKGRLVVMSADHYRKLTERSGIQAFTLQDAPPAAMDELMTGLAQLPQS